MTTSSASKAKSAPVRSRPRPDARERVQPHPAAQELPPDFEAWFRDHREPVYRYVRFRVATRDVAEDLTSDVFIKALRSLGSYDPRKSAPRTWLLRIARNAVTDYLRTLQRRGRLHVSLDRVPDLVHRAPSQEERMLRAEQVQRLLNAVATLRAADQEVLSLRYGAGLANLEIAETLKISANAVAVRVHRALSRLRAAVAETAGAED
ncbi:MAG: sigma-70 family RNA polymerase sigma factor [Gemmatimonadetes bacterium]|nr:sigma-70 family RNA polymerase sigma factor [Gemmatimonadota bacterium]MYE15508.1 sigma-70 family RNA polymerase sigma factor [Gemmatimonadota bacterium]